MRFLVDAQLPPALARWLNARGHDAEASGAVIVTKDEDFAIRRTFASTGPRVVWIRLGNTRRHVLLAWFEEQLPALLAALDAGESLIEIA